MSDCNGHTPGPLAHLSPAHLADLRRSGLADPIILAAGVKTVKDADLIKRCLNWDYSASKLGECLAFPYRTPDGGKSGFVRFRPDNPRVKGRKTTKYESPMGAPLRLYLSPTATAEALADATLPLLFIEGEKKTLRAAQEGFVAVGVAGVWAWQVGREEGKDGKKQGPRQLLPDFDPIVLTERRVFLIFDSDASTNPKAAWGEFHLADRLRIRGRTFASCDCLQDRRGRTASRKKSASTTTC